MIDVIGLARTPFSPILGQLCSVSSLKLGLKSATKCINNSFLSKELIDSLILSQVFPYGLGPSPSKQIINHLGLNNCNNYYVNNLCLSGLKAVDQAYNLISSERSQVSAVIGTESCSNIPYLLNDIRNKGYKFGNNTLFDPLIRDYTNFEFDFEISQSQVNRYIEDSFEKIASSYSQGIIQNEISSIKIKTMQNNKMVEKKINEDELYRMFKKNINYSKVSTFSDGSASLLLCSSKVTKKYNLTPICKIRSIYNSNKSVKYNNNSNGSNNDNIDDIVNDIVECVNHYKSNNVDIFEILDQNVLIPILVSKVSEIDLSRVNLLGGTIAIGHALGATGIRQIINLITNLKTNNLRFGLVVGSDLMGDSMGILIENCF